MGETKIEWTDTTWNPTRGCSRVSPGCENCYAERLAIRMAGPGRPYEGLARSTPSGPRWTRRVVPVPEVLDQPLRWRKPRRVFVNSMSDLFHEDVPDGFIAWVWWVMAHTPQHTYQILTKRPARMAAWVRRWEDRTGDEDADSGGSLPPMPRGPAAIRSTYISGRAHLFAAMLEQWGEPPEGAAYPAYDWMDGPRFWPGLLPNVWLGVSAEDQERADERIPLLLDTPAAVRFVSYEPALGPIDLEPWLYEPMKCRVCGSPLVAYEPNPTGEHFDTCMMGCSHAGEPGAERCVSCGSLEIDLMPRIDWVIAGSESGPDARPAELDWYRSVRDQCARAGVAFFLKQHVDGGKKISLPVLDGRRHTEFPEVRQ